MTKKRLNLSSKLSRTDLHEQQISVGDKFGKSKRPTKKSFEDEYFLQTFYSSNMKTKK